MLWGEGGGEEAEECGGGEDAFAGACFDGAEDGGDLACGEDDGGDEDGEDEDAGEASLEVEPADGGVLDEFVEPDGGDDGEDEKRTKHQALLQHAR